MDKQRRLEILLEENQQMTYFKERDFKKYDEELKAEKATYEDALTQVQPWRIAVGEAFNNIKKTDISEISSLPKPPKTILTLCQCFAMLRGLDEQEVADATPFQWSDYRFMKSLRELNMDNMTHKQTSNIKALLEKVSEEEMRKVCQAGLSPLHYIHTVLDYCRATRKVHLNKKRESLAKVQDRYNQKKRELEKMKADKVSMDNELQQLVGKEQRDTD